LKLLEYPKTQKINLISKYPEIEKDLSFSSNKSINLNAIKAELINKYPLIKSLNIFDLYLKGKLTKFAMRIKFQSFTGTLTNLEIETEIQKIIAYLHKQYSLNLAI
jgi:phenylalanyl-tRNA synthetase beta subunit